jgi:hypothetical protein
MEHFEQLCPQSERPVLQTVQWPGQRVSQPLAEHRSRQQRRTQL